MKNILHEIVDASRRDLEERKKNVPVAMLERRFGQPGPDFAAALRKPGIRVIAELKCASPSKGVIRGDFPVAELAPELEASGAAALSILTEEHFFRGSLRNLEVAADTVAIPLLRKDFIHDEYQLFEARAAGASAVLLIAAMLDDAAYARLYRRATELGLSVLTEVHDAAELERMLDFEAPILGVNARDLKTFQTSAEVAATLIARIPASRIRVAESAILCRDDLEKMRTAGAHAFLVGEALMCAAHPGEKLRELLGNGN